MTIFFLWFKVHIKIIYEQRFSKRIESDNEFGIMYKCKLIFIIFILFNPTLSHNLSTSLWYILTRTVYVVNDTYYFHKIN